MGASVSSSSTPNSLEEFDGGDYPREDNCTTLSVSQARIDTTIEIQYDPEQRTTRGYNHQWKKDMY